MVDKPGEMNITQIHQTDATVVVGFSIHFMDASDMVPIRDYCNSMVSGTMALIGSAGGSDIKARIDTGWGLTSYYCRHSDAGMVMKQHDLGDVLL